MTKLGKIAVVAALMAAPLVGVSTPAEAAASCKPHKVPKKSYWVCVTPGAYCPTAAHSKYGYGKAAPHRRYKCLKYSNGKWRWKRA